MILDSEILSKISSIKDDDFFYYSPDYLTTLPESAPHIFVVERLNSIYGLAIFTKKVESIDLFQDPNSLLSQFTSTIRKLWPNFLNLSTIECGPSMVSGSFMLFNKGIEPHLKNTYVTLEVIRKSLDIMTKEKADLVVFRDFQEDSPIFASFGFRKIPLLDEAILEVKWDTFDHYLASIKSHYRSMIKKDIKKLGDLRVEHTTSFSEHAKDMFALWTQTQSRSSEYQSNENISHGYFYRLSTMTKSSANLVFKGEKLVGFNVLVRGGNSLYPLWVGIDYKLRNQYALLFNLYYQTIKVAISENMKIIHFGDTTYDLKLRIGCYLKPQFAYCYSRIPFFTHLLEKVSKYLVPEQVTKKRNIWKV